MRRIKRIVPAYFTVILLCAVLLWPLSKLSFSGYFLDAQFWRYLAANLSFQNYIEPCLPNVFENNLICAVNGSLWTIKVEEGFYLSVPIFYWLIKAKKINFWMLSIAVVTLTLFLSVVSWNYIELPFLSNDRKARHKKLLSINKK